MRRSHRGLEAWALVVSLALGCTGHECTPSAQQACSRTLDGGVTQSGFQLCGSAGTWSACVPVGHCRGGGAKDVVYTRCNDDEECGPSGCAICSRYGGVNNPSAYSLCMPFCQLDSECAPTSASSGVTARCVLGQCALFCRTGSVCPRDTQCMPWDSDALRTANPSFAGLCE